MNDKEHYLNLFKKCVPEGIYLIPEAYDFAVDRINIRTDIGKGFHGRDRKLMSLDEAVNQVVGLFESAKWDTALMGIFPGYNYD